MKRSSEIYKKYLKCLTDELVPAFGCTEPAAVAYAAAIAAEKLGGMPESVCLTCSGNIIKNVKSVIVPNSGGLKGLEVAVAAGILAGHPEEKLALLSFLPENSEKAIGELLSKMTVEVKVSKSGYPFDIEIEAASSEHKAEVRIISSHTNVVKIVRDGETLLEKAYAAPDENELSDVGLKVQDILDFAEALDPNDVKDVLDRQIKYNMAIAEEGMNHEYGANIGTVMMDWGKGIGAKIKAYAAAGSDARMSGCEMPVIINSGSGNQGIAVSVPVIVYAKQKKADKTELYKALVVSNLLAIYQRSGIGCLSAYCGAINAGVAAVCGIAYMDGARFDTISHVLVNGLAVSSGVICDGAKPSCAAKIAIGIESGLMGYVMYRHNQQFRSGDGIVKKGADATIAAVSRIGRYGMRETDQEILNIMIGN